ncbi:hypothetical protein T484DRAFT_1811091 [Baffinella frigidus]|nr:hypothetical protein T484DRAFT_1811091 [Cryptophyta sp. CCMP2293]
MAQRDIPPSSLPRIPQPQEEIEDDAASFSPAVFDQPERLQNLSVAVATQHEVEQAVSAVRTLTSMSATALALIAHGFPAVYRSAPAQTGGQAVNLALSRELQVVARNVVRGQRRLHVTCRSFGFHPLIAHLLYLTLSAASASALVFAAGVLLFAANLLGGGGSFILSVVGALASWAALGGAAGVAVVGGRI